MAIVLVGGDVTEEAGRSGLGLIRLKFIEASGRYDLENEDGTDNGANWYIRAGQRLLDRQLCNAELIGTDTVPELLGDTDSNFWTEQHPDILVQASMLKLEGFFRNYSGWKDAHQALMRDISDLDMSLVMDQSSDVSIMEG